VYKIRKKLWRIQEEASMAAEGKAVAPCADILHSLLSIKVQQPCSSRAADK
jgi:hypothetical protein